MKCGGLGYSIGAVYSVHYLRNCLTAESLDERDTRNNNTERESNRKKKVREKELMKALPECVTPLLSM